MSENPNAVDTRAVVNEILDSFITESTSMLRRQYEAGLQKAETDAATWKRLFEEQVKAQRDLAEWVQKHAKSGYGQVHSTVALRMLKEQHDEIEVIKALRKEEGALINRLRAETQTLRDEITRLKSWMVVRKPAAQPLTGVESNAREGLWQALRSVGDARAARICDAIAAAVQEAIAGHEKLRH